MRESNVETKGKVTLNGAWKVFWKVLKTAFGKAAGLLSIGLFAACTYQPLIENPKEEDFSVTVREDQIRIPGAPHKFNRIVFENNELMLSFLPELGGRIYEFVYKKTGNNQLFKNPVWKSTGWGVNSCRPLGEWKAVGGIEFGFPEAEHGCVHDLPFKYEIVELDDRGKMIRMRRDPSRKETWGLELTVEVTLRPRQRSFRIDSIIENPTPGKGRFQFWVNGMLSPGSKDPRDANLKMIFPNFISSMILHGWGGEKSKGPAPRPRTNFAWPSPFERYDHFKDEGSLGFFTSENVPFVALVNQVEREGVLRTFQPEQGLKIFALGPTEWEAYTSKNAQYFEVWAGIGQDFWTHAEIPGLGKIQVSEIWTPFTYRTPSELPSVIQRLTK